MNELIEPFVFFFTYLSIFVGLLLLWLYLPPRPRIRY